MTKFVVGPGCRYKVWGRDVYCATPRIWLAVSIYCLVVLRLFPAFRREREKELLAGEREACASLADPADDGRDEDIIHMDDQARDAGRSIAAAIRART